MAPNRLQSPELSMVGDSIYEFQLQDSVYRLNTNAQLKVVSRRIEPRLKVVQQVNEAIFKEFPDKRRCSPLPKEYIQYNGKEVETDEEAIEYDIDDEDLVWLDLINERRKKEKLKSITEKLLEHGIDRFEKASYFQNTDAARAPAIDNDAVCCICLDGDDSNANQIIFCDMCNIAVHQECYGVPYIPSGQWLCRRCQLSPSEAVKCVFCPYTNGAFKQTSDNHWAHVVCALWLSEVHFANAVFLEPVEGVTFSLKRRCKLTCGVCRIKMGACLQCSKKSCVRPFHVTCAMFAEMHMKVETQEKQKDGADETIVNRFAFCHQHSALITKTMPPTKAAFKRQTQEKIKKARKIIQSASSQSSHQVAVPVISAKRLEAIREELKMEKMEDLLAYWSLKRHSRCGVPLIRRLQVYTSRKQLGRRSNEGLGDSHQSGSSIGDVELISSNQKGFANQLYRMGKLRNNLEKLRLLIELTKKREKYKSEMTANFREIIEITLKPTITILEGVLDKLIEKDHQKVFIKPVSDEEVPGYRKVIKKPMDFERMRSKLQNGEYKRVADLRVDFDLMMNNCALFNKDNYFYWRYGHTMHSIGSKLLRTAEQDEQIAASGKLIADAIPLMFEEGEIDKELQAFNSQCYVVDEKSETRKRKFSTTSSRRKSLETKIYDYFKPSSGTPSSPARKLVKQEKSDVKRKRTSQTSRRQRIGASGTLASYFQQDLQTEKETEEESERASTSDDEEFGTKSKRKLTEKLAEKRAATVKQPRTPKQKTSPRATDSLGHQEIYAHDDIVWAPLSRGGERMPARVYDRTMIALEEDHLIRDRIQKMPPQNNIHQSLVVFFDADPTIMYVQTQDLEHCNVDQRLSRSEAPHILAAFRRAKEFCDELGDVST